MKAQLPKGCAGCGACCEHLKVEITADDATVLRDMGKGDAVVEVDGRLWMRKWPNGACVLLNQTTGMCTIWPTVPKLCAEFPKGCSLCWDSLYVRRQDLIYGEADKEE